MSDDDDKANAQEEATRELLTAYEKLVRMTMLDVSNSDRAKNLTKTVQAMSENQAKAMLIARVVADALRKVEAAERSSRVAEARVRGFQGKDLSLPNTLAACTKHFAGYGFAEGGRDSRGRNPLVDELPRQLVGQGIGDAVRGGADLSPCGSGHRHGGEHLEHRHGHQHRDRE